MLLLLIVFFVLAIQDGIADQLGTSCELPLEGQATDEESTAAITCNRAVDSHCPKCSMIVRQKVKLTSAFAVFPGIYGPTALDRVNGTPPDLKLDSGTLFTKQVDGAGACQSPRVVDTLLASR